MLPRPVLPTAGCLAHIEAMGVRFPHRARGCGETWQTHPVEGRTPKGMEVQVLSAAPLRLAPRALCAREGQAKRRHGEAAPHLFREQEEAQCKSGVSDQNYRAIGLLSYWRRVGGDFSDNAERVVVKRASYYCSAITRYPNLSILS